MKILDTQTGDTHEYGADGHDSLRVSQDGRYLTYYNLQNGDGSKYGDYRFVCDDNKIPSESETADARHAQVFFNIGGWHKRPQGEWLNRETGGTMYPFWERCECNQCHKFNNYSNFCPNCGAEMKDGAENDIARFT